MSNTNIRVLVTGAAGNIGQHIIEELLGQSYTVRAFDLNRRSTRKALSRFKKRIEIHWGDLTSMQDVRRAVTDQDFILHNASLLPPLTEINPELSEKVNVGGSRQLFEAAQSCSSPPKILLASSIAVFGNCHINDKLIRPHDLPQPTDNYGQQKLNVENMLRNLMLDWCIVRIGVCPPTTPSLASGNVLTELFTYSLNSKVEYVHPKDVAYAQVQAISTKTAWGKIFLLGGGKDSQISSRNLIQDTFEAFGIGALPSDAFGHKQFPAGWLDTEQSQQLLSYQRHTYHNWQKKLRRSLKMIRPIVLCLSPIVRKILLSYSHSYQQNNT